MADFSISQSTSTGGLPDISALAEQMMQQQYAWGQAQFQKNSQLTDQVVGDLMNLYGSLSGVGNTLMSEYNNMFVPEYQKLVTDANNYASQARIQQAMGAAESGVSQSFNGQRNAALADLQSFGIDPSSGRYAQLDEAERTQQAAAQAGAGFQAEQSTEATGRALRSEALQLGSVMPSQATAAYNAAQGAATAGENAKLANSQEGVNMMGSPPALGAVGQQLRKAQSNSMSGKGGGGQVTDKGNSNGSSGRDTGHPGAPTIPGSSPSYPGQFGGGGAGGGQGGGAGGGGGPPNAAIHSGGGGPPGIETSDTSQGDNTFTAGGANDQSTNDTTYGESDLGWNTSSAGGANDQSTADATYGGNGDYGSGATGDNSNSAGGANDWSSGDPTQDTSQWNDTSGDQYSGSSGDQFAGDYGGSEFDQSAATGGVLQRTKGAIPFSHSPSHGKVTDDVRAKLNDTGEDIRLNAGEFVIPRHAVAWRGEKFYQDLIAKSKREREAATAKPTMKPALPALRHTA